MRSLYKIYLASSYYVSLLKLETQFILESCAIYLSCKIMAFLSQAIFKMLTSHQKKEILELIIASLRESECQTIYRNK